MFGEYEPVVTDPEIEALRERLASLRIPKVKLFKKNKKCLHEEELSVLRTRNTILRSVAEVLAMRTGGCKSAGHLTRHHSAFIKINASVQNNFLNGHQPADNDECGSEKQKLGLIDLETLIDLTHSRSLNEQVRPSSDSSIQSFVNCVRSKPINFLIQQLRANQSHNQRRISELLSDIDKRRKQKLDQESFFCRHPSLMTSENRNMSLFINNIKEKSLVYNLKSSFPIEGKYLQMMEDYIKFNSKKQMLEYNGSCKINSHGQRKTDSFIGRYRLPGLQFRRL